MTAVLLHERFNVILISEKSALRINALLYPHFRLLSVVEKSEQTARFASPFFRFSEQRVNHYHRLNRNRHQKQRPQIVLKKL